MGATIPLYSRSSDIKTLVLGGGCETGWLLSHLYRDELPDAVWFILGTAIHNTIERAVLDDLTLDEMQADVSMNLVIGLGEATRGIIESKSNRSKRNVSTILDDAHRMVTKWWNDVHPTGNNRHPLFGKYDWPPRVEHRISVTTTDYPETNLITTVDAIFDGGPFGEATLICDWKTGASTTAAASQLQTYFYGLVIDGELDPAENDLQVGAFWHVDHDKQQPVPNYYGNTVIDRWIRRTHAAKLSMFDTGPVCAPDWWCNYCVAREKCPVKGEGNWKEIGIRMDEATLIIEPTPQEGE